MNQTEILSTLKEAEDFYRKLNIQLNDEWQLAKTSRKAKISKCLLEVVRSSSNVKMLLNILEVDPETVDPETSKDSDFWKGIRKAALSDAENQIAAYRLIKEAANVQ